MKQQVRYLKNKKYDLLFFDYLDSLGKGDIYNFVEPINFKKYCISVFDHWLNNEEFNEKVNTFDDLTKSIENNIVDFSYLEKIVKNYYLIESKLLLFYLSLYKNFNVIFYHYDKSQFFKCKNLEKYIEICQNSIRENESTNWYLPEFYIPEIKTIIVGNRNFTPVVYYKGEQNFLKLKKYVEEASLYILK